MRSVQVLSLSIALSIAALTFVLLVPARSVAQDFSSIPYSVAMTGVLHKAKMKAIYGKRAKHAKLAQTAPPQSRPSGFHYRFDPALSKQIQQDFIARATQNDAVAGAALARQMQIHDFHEVYRQIAESFGLRPRDPVDSMTAYTLLAYLIATGASDPGQLEVQAVRSDVESALIPTLSGMPAAERQAFDEELVYLFVTMHSSWRSAVEREGPAALQLFSDNVNELWRAKFGQDMRQLRLTASGFVKT